MTPASSWSPRSKLTAVFLAGVLVGAVSMFEVVPERSLGGTRLAAGSDVADGDGEPGGIGTEGVAGGDGVEGGEGGGGGGAAGTASGAGGAAGGGGGGAGRAASGRAGLRCDRSGNGGATDRGVTADKIKLATTVVESGPGASFQSEMRFAMEAVVRATNRAGGICGRQLEVTYKDDAWDPQRGGQYLRTMIESGIFAIPVGASSEGIGTIIETGDLEKHRIPVVGTDGLEIIQYQHKGGGAQPWVWPVATATVSSARIMANEAHKRGARKFGVVFDENYKFGKEGAAAFKAEVAKLGASVPGDSCASRFCPLQVGKNSYGTEAAQFYGNSLDFVALFLEPETALTWMKDPNTPAANKNGDRPEDIKYGYGAAQPLFTNKFGTDCGGKCDQMKVWTGFKPYIESYENDQAVRDYVNAMKSVKPNIDIYNQFSQGAYVGMQLFVEALKEVGPDLTRERLREVLNRITLATGLTIQDKLTYTPANRFTNVTMQAFVMQYKGSWGRWRADATVVDPRPTAGVG